MGAISNKEKCYAKLRRVDYFLTLEEYVGKPSRPVEDELREMWHIQSGIVELHSAHRKLEWAFDEVWIWSQHEREHMWQYFSLFYRCKGPPSSLLEMAFESWLQDIKQTGQFTPIFVHHNAEDFINHCRTFADKLQERYSNKQYTLTKDEFLSLAAVISPIGLISLEFFLRGALDHKNRYSFTSVLTNGYRGLVKLARTTTPSERVYFWESFLSDGIFGKSGADLLTPDELGFRGAVSRTFVHATCDIEHILKWKTDWKNLVIYEVEERNEDEGGIRNGVEFPISYNENEAKCTVRVYPPLTTFLVKRHYTCRFPVESVGKSANSIFSEEKNPLEITFIVLEPLFSPTSHLPQIVPSEDIWDAVRRGESTVIRDWLKENPSVNLEELHPLYHCCLLYSAARSGHINVVRELVKGCAHVNTQKSKTGSTPLHAACYFGYEEIVEFLLQQGANPEIKNSHGYLPFQEVPINKPVIRDMLLSWKKPTPKKSGGKLVVSYLVYGDRMHYLKGLETLLGNPVITMKEEFNRKIIFYEKASGYHKSHEVYSNAEAVLQQLQTLPEAQSLTAEEILALRIYTGPFYVVINQFLREIHQANKKQKKLPPLQTTHLGLYNPPP
jgi:hypothetical protein